MEKTAKNHNKNSNKEFITFYIGDALCGIDLLKVQEVIKHTDITQVPQAPEYVLGILNLRGRIITVIDIGKKLELSPIESDKNNRNVIVNSLDEHIGLLVDRISDVLQVKSDRIEPTPSNIGGIQKEFFKGVYKTAKNLIGILDIDEVLK